MENGRSQQRVCLAFQHALSEMLQFAHAAAGYHRHRHCRTDGAGKRQVVAVFGAVSVHGSEQDFARPSFCGFGCPGYGVFACGGAPAVSGDFILGGDFMLG